MRHKSRTGTKAGRGVRQLVIPRTQRFRRVTTPTRRTRRWPTLFCPPAVPSARHFLLGPAFRTMVLQCRMYFHCARLPWAARNCPKQTRSQPNTSASPRACPARGLAVRSGRRAVTRPRPLQSCAQALVLLRFPFPFPRLVSSANRTHQEQGLQQSR